LRTRRAFSSDSSSGRIRAASAPATPASTGAIGELAACRRRAAAAAPWPMSAPANAAARPSANEKS
jgi:hypothetical protein